MIMFEIAHLVLPLVNSFSRLILYCNNLLQSMYIIYIYIIPTFLLHPYAVAVPDFISPKPISLCLPPLDTY